MANIFSFLSKDKDKTVTNTNPGASQPAPGTSIYFNPTLIPHLKGDHGKLLGVFKTIQGELEAENFEGVRQQLGAFKALLQEHLLTENLKLYVYLSKQLASDEASSGIINDFRREMNDIGRVVMDFLRRYSETMLDRPRAPAFRAELEQIGQALVKRMQREESTLYPLYLEHY